MMEFVVKKCTKCGNLRKFLKDTERDLQSICGNCWDWGKTPLPVYLSPTEFQKLQAMLKDFKQ